MHQTGDGLLEFGEDKGSESELCPRALTKVLHTGCYGDNFFLSDILCDIFRDFHHEHDC
jgi:hypothetical protein